MKPGDTVWRVDETPALLSGELERLFDDGDLTVREMQISGGFTRQSVEQVGDSLVPLGGLGHRWYATRENALEAARLEASATVEDCEESLRLALSREHKLKRLVSCPSGDEEG